MKIRLVFAGTPDFAATILKNILAVQEIEVLCVLTQPDRSSGRGKKVSLSPVKSLAISNNIHVLQPNSLKRSSDDIIAHIRSLEPDLMLVAAYGLILPQTVLDIPKLGCINAHASMLPRWRGASPIQHAIFSGDQSSGVCMIKMEAGLDSGPVLLKQGIDIEKNETGGTLHDKLADIASELSIKVLHMAIKGQLSPEEQHHESATYAPKIEKSDAKINWFQDAGIIERYVRAFIPWPISYTSISGKNYRIWGCQHIQQDNLSSPGTIQNIGPDGIDVCCNKDLIRIKIIQAPGRKALNVRDFINALPNEIKVGAQFE